jgi:hypothetical protein
MATKTDRSAILSECCDAKDLVRQKTGILLWCLPTIVLVASLSWATLRPWIWIPAFLIMGVGCLVNASRCGRLHFYITGPIFLLAATYVGLSTMSIVPIRPGIFLFGVLAIAMLACLAELPPGRYKRSA